MDDLERSLQRILNAHEAMRPFVDGLRSAFELLQWFAAQGEDPAQLAHEMAEVFREVARYLDDMPGPDGWKPLDLGRIGYG